MQMIMPRNRLSHWQIFDDAMIFVRREFEDILALIEFDPRISRDNVRMFFENEEVVLFRDEVVGIVVPNEPPVFPFFDYWSRTQGTFVRSFPCLVFRLRFRFSKSEHRNFRNKKSRTLPLTRMDSTMTKVL